MELQLKATVVFDKTREAKTRIVVNEGGSRSSKTYSIAQMFFLKMLEEKDILISVVRKTTPALKATAYKDFLDVLRSNYVYNEDFHNKTEMTYKIGSNEIEFFSCDEPQKMRGRKRHYLWENEANELSYEDHKQLAMRTTKQIFMDYNPSETFHWIYDHVLTRDDVTLIKSTYKDNPFLELEIVKEIERYKETDENYWRIYGLGERGVPQATIYPTYFLIDEMPTDGEEIYGLDFGYNHPTSLCRIMLKDDEVYCEEVIYESGLTNSQLIKKMDSLDIKKNVIIYADHEDANRIKEISDAGYWIEKANKSVKDGIDSLITRKKHITKKSIHGIKEFQMYKWKQKDERVLDEPVKLNDDFLDSLRYGVYSHITKQFIGFV
jgi:phage terminase large subunit